MFVALFGREAFLRISSIVVLVLNFISFIALSGSVRNPYWKCTADTNPFVIAIHLNGIERCDTASISQCTAAPFWSSYWSDYLGQAATASQFANDSTNLLWAAISILIIGWMCVSHGLLFFRIAARKKWSLLIMISGFAITLVGMMLAISVSAHIPDRLLPDLVCALEGSDVDPLFLNTFCPSAAIRPSFQGSSSWNGATYSWGPAEGFRTIVLGTVISCFAGCISTLAGVSAIILFRRDLSASSSSSSSAAADSRSSVRSYQRASPSRSTDDQSVVREGAEAAEPLYGDPEADHPLTPSTHAPRSTPGYGSI